jgi:hypothetical protein
MASVNKSKTDSALFGLGVERGKFDLQLTNVEEIFIESAKMFITLAKKRLKQKNKIDTGNLDDLVITNISNDNSKFGIQIGYEDGNPAINYYDFQNKGVKGVKSNRPNSEYKFQSLNVSNKMIQAIMKWYLRHKNYVKNEDQRKNLSSLQRKRRSISQAAKSQFFVIKPLAIATAINIKKKGIARTGFIDDNIDLVYNEAFAQKVGAALGKDFIISITQEFNGNNNNK